MFALRDVSQNLANLETAANFFNFKKFVRRFIIQVPATQSGSLPLPHECNSFVKCTQSFNVAGTTITCSLCDVSLSGEDFSSGNTILLMKIRSVKHPSARGRAFVPASFFCIFQRGSLSSMLDETLNSLKKEREKIMKDLLENVIIVALCVMTGIMFITLNAGGYSFIVSASVAVALAAAFAIVEATDLVIGWWHGLSD